MDDLRLYLLGTPRLEYQHERVKVERRKALALAAYLALSEHPQSRESIAGLLWPDLDDLHARSALRTSLRALSGTVPVEWIQSDRTMLSIKPDTVWVDVTMFRQLLASTRAHGHDADTFCVECARQYEQAVDLYRADFLLESDLCDCADFENWQLAQRGWLRRDLGRSHERLSAYYAAEQQFERAIHHAREWLALDTLHEPAHRQLMILYAASGKRSDALRQYQVCVELLDAELLTPPDEETTRLYESIQNNALNPPGLQSRAAVAPVGVMPPAPSLVIGRQEAIGEIKRRIGIGGEMRPVTIIQGWPGVGKSTAVASLAHDVEVAQQFPDGVLWASLGERPNLLVEISAWSDAVMPGQRGQTRRIEDISAQLTSALRERRMLLIVDDVWQVEHARPFRVGGQGCALVMTSRLNDVASALASTAGDVYRLPVLSEASALELLEQLCPETVAEYPLEASELVHDLEGLPLAIQVAGRLLHSEARFGWGVRELLDELRTGASLLNTQIPSEMFSADDRPSPTVAALLKRSTDLLDSETRKLFSYLGLFVPKPATFDLAAMAAAWMVGDARKIARVLVDRGLLEPLGGGRFQMHALLVMHARSLLEEAA